MSSKPVGQHSDQYTLEHTGQHTGQHTGLGRLLSLEIVRVTEQAAVAAARLRGRGAEKMSDQAAVDAMRRELSALAIDGKVVIGEGEMDAAPMLFIGEKVGTGSGPKVDIAVDPLEGTTLCAKNMPGAIATLAMAQHGTLLHAPDIYMDKIAVGPGYPKGVVDLDAPAEDNIVNLAKAKGVKPEAITAMILDRPRHADLIGAVRKAGAAVSLISDGDVAGVIHTADPDKTGIDIYLGIGGAPEGVLAAAALPLHRRADADAARARYRRKTLTRRQNGYQRSPPQISA
jgi:fructose-1,6-bisphosphatase II / sedoheptulose-1,7-bisphosphatase